jgi:outer membrane protein OmpA-like peptidoglycan-associated protein
MSQTDKTPQEEKVLEDALSPIVNRLIDKSFENSGDKMASHIAPLIGGAIREQIKHQKDDIVDALYPVMGNMITKFVTKSLEELLSKINDQIQNGLSANAIKRKIKAKIKGVSETELLLEENSIAKIKAALLIHKESGALLCKAEDENASLSDADMLASMMSAIRSFVNEWINNNENYKELGEIEYGGNKIVIETSGHSYLAVIVEGAIYAKTYKRIRQTLEQIVLAYGDDIGAFKGSFETFPKEEVEKELQKLLLVQEDETQQNKKRSPLLWIIALLFMGYLGYLLYGEYQDKEQQREVQSIIAENPLLSPYNIKVDVKGGITTIQGRLPFAYHKKLLTDLVVPFTTAKRLHNEVKVTPTLTDPMQVSANIAYLLKGANLNPNNNINYNFDYNRVTLTGKVADKKSHHKLLMALHKIEGIKQIEDKTVIQTPPTPKPIHQELNFKSDLYFKSGSTRLNRQTKKRLDKLLQLLQNRTTKKVIQINAYSDMIGNETKNRVLAQKRVNAIKSYLIHKGQIQNNIQTAIYNRPPKGVNPKKDPNKARCIQISLQKKEQK